jgi:hypothetical protein
MISVFDLFKIEIGPFVAGRDTTVKSQAGADHEA